MHLYQVRTDFQNQTQSLLSNTFLLHFALTFVWKQDEQYQEKLVIPHMGLDLGTRIYVAVKATNLTNRYFKEIAPDFYFIILKFSNTRLKHSYNQFTLNMMMQSRRNFF